MIKYGNMSKKNHKNDDTNNTEEIDLTTKNSIEDVLLSDDIDLDLVDGDDLVITTEEETLTIIIEDDQDLLEDEEFLLGGIKKKKNHKTDDESDDEVEDFDSYFFQEE